MQYVPRVIQGHIKIKQDNTIVFYVRKECSNQIQDKRLVKFAALDRLKVPREVQLAPRVVQGLIRIKQDNTLASYVRKECSSLIKDKPLVRSAPLEHLKMPKAERHVLNVMLDHTKTRLDKPHVYFVLKGSTNLLSE